MMDYRWTTTLGGSEAARHITYAFATGPSDFTNVPGGYVGPALAPRRAKLSASQKQAVLTVFGLISSYTGLTFTQAASTSAKDAVFRFANFNDTVRNPVSGQPGHLCAVRERQCGGHVAGAERQCPGPLLRHRRFPDHRHEMGHAFGLKHGHDGDYNGTLAAELNDTNSQP